MFLICRYVYLRINFNFFLNKKNIPVKSKLFKIFVLLSAISLILFSCKKDKRFVYIPPANSGCTDKTAVNWDPGAQNNDGSCVYQKQIQSIIDNSTAERVIGEIFPVVNQVGRSEAAGDTAIIKCATITSSGPGYPKTMTIDYGPVGTCTCDDGFKRKNTIIAIFNSPWSFPFGAVTLSFINYEILYDINTTDWMWFESSGFSVNKTTAVIVDSSTGDTSIIVSYSQIVSFGLLHRKNLQDSFPTFNDIVIEISSNRTMEQVGGEGTDDVTDDEFEYYGTANGINRDTVPFISIIDPYPDARLRKSFDCKHITKGKMHVKQLQPDEVFNELNYGSGNCDNQGSIFRPGAGVISISLE